VFSSELVRAQLKRAAAGLPMNWTVKLKPSLSRPRIYDPYTDFNAIRNDGWYGCYVIYAPDPQPKASTGPSRIVYIGKGQIDVRIRSHLTTKPELLRLSHKIGLKFVAITWGDIVEPDSPAAWLCEQILLHEHKSMFNSLPKFNKQGPTSEIIAWRRALRWSKPGPKAILTRYGS
jgi:hypothetical protein